MMFRSFILSLLLFIAPCVYAQEVIPDFKSEDSLGTLNEELRKIIESVKDVDDVTIEISNGDITLKLAPVANGGLGEDFSSVATGGMLFFDGVGNIGIKVKGTDDTVWTMVGGIPGWEATRKIGLEFISKTPIGVDSDNSGDILITQGVRYLVIIEINAQGATGPDIRLRFNSDSGNHYGNSGETKTADDKINLFSSIFDSNTNEGSGFARFIISPFRTDQIVVRGDSVHIDNSSNIIQFEITGFWNDDTTVTSFEIITTNGNKMNGNNVLVYKLNES